LVDRGAPQRVGRVSSVDGDRAAFSVAAPGGDEDTMRGTQFAQLTAFAAVAEHQSFTRAAEHLQMSAPWLSQTVRLLEEQFGVRLLNRTTRSVALTEAGEELLAHLTSAIEAVDRGVEAVLASRDRAAGVLRLSVHPIAAAAVIAPLLPDFSAAFGWRYR